MLVEVWFYDENDSSQTRYETFRTTYLSFTDEPAWTIENESINLDPDYISEHGLILVRYAYMVDLNSMSEDDPPTRPARIAPYHLLVPPEHVNSIFKVAVDGQTVLTRNPQGELIEITMSCIIAADSNSAL